MIKTDLHMHIVPDFDDGSQDLQMSLDMLSSAYKQGVRKIFCTSHSCYFIDKNQKYYETFNELKNEAKIRFPDVELYPGSEVEIENYYLNEIVSKLINGTIPTLNGSKYVLTEFYPDVEKKEAMNIINKLLSNGFIPIIAHAERYWELNLCTIKEMTEKGCLIQINLYSLEQVYDITTRGIAIDLIQHRLVSFIGSDAHRMDHRPPKYTCGEVVLRRICDEEYLKDICYRNAEKMLI